MSRSLPRALAAAAVAMVLALSGCASDAASSKTFRFTSATALGTVLPASARMPAADIDGPLLSGGRTSLASMRGKVVVVNFWASWCGPCKIETPQLDLLSRRVKAKGVAFVGIDSKDARENANTFIDSYQISYPMLYDPQGKVALKLGNIPGSLPFSVLVDAKGRVAAVYLGAVTNKDLEKSLDTLLAER